MNPLQKPQNMKMIPVLRPIFSNGGCPSQVPTSTSASLQKVGPDARFCSQGAGPEVTSVAVESSSGLDGRQQDMLQALQAACLDFSGSVCIRAAPYRRTRYQSVINIAKDAFSSAIG